MTDNNNIPKSAPSLIDLREDVFLTEKDLAKRHQRTPKTLRNDRCRGGYIPFVKIGRHIRYRLSDVLSYEQARVMTSTSAVDLVEPRRSPRGRPAL
jgi:hypothetical protein